VIGIDDWTFRKGKICGTIIVDLESHRPIDLLSSREGAVVKQQLRAHPTVEG
jgi:transposase